MIKASQLVGRAVIDMEAAERLGRIKEIIFQRDGERVAGFIVVRGETLVGTGGTRHVGRDLIVVPDDALIEGEPGTHEGDRETAPAKNDEADSHRWKERASAESRRSSIWTRRTDRPAQVRSEAPSAEPRLKSETARAVENTNPSSAEDTAVETSPLDRDAAEVTVAPGHESRT